MTFPLFKNVSSLCPSFVLDYIVSLVLNVLPGFLSNTYIYKPILVILYIAVWNARKTSDYSKLFTKYIFICGYRCCKKKKKNLSICFPINFGLKYVCTCLFDLCFINIDWHIKSHSELTLNCLNLVMPFFYYLISIITIL